ncbi:hypothetical protein GLOTRDRAFT_58836 [Gloeophyllum trabeum ATCC 11539]|uniref:RRM domain-containing protein n=1 Tax=Gloeophyllum trabeum (strain ATCC 11539 / FP-39264 / Madison 617) TaxID=670483 RepID=S7QDJ2_GLOTA|nr:uncharacterized protein GLOTRDRAFT_58836 [Gloeophyllum trabeum ATCC 11539]EPQ57458.1 hypothetical protein GLOTRDRAFT_58836 [Gloeophyllum trabeum ATCC 11539]
MSAPHNAEASSSSGATRAPPTLLASSTAEQQAAAFDADPNTYFDKESGTWRYENEDGTELEWDTKKNAWVPVVDEDLLKSQQAAYSVAGVDESTPAAPVLARDKKKRKQRDNNNDEPYLGPAAKRNKKKEPAPGERKSKNTAVYVTGLPADTEFDELHERFSKCGLIEEDDQGEPKIKMYARDDGSFSGEALVVYFKEDSVTLALNILDDAELRLGDASTRMRVQKADFAHKAGGGGGNGSGGGEGNTERKTVDRKRATRRITKMQKKLEEWDDEEEGFGPLLDKNDKSQSINKNSRVVVLKHMFTLQELEEDASLLLDLKEDVREECSTLGEVTNVVLYDAEPEGIMTVKFRDPLSAQACVLKMNGRFFAGRRIEASLYSGRQRFKKSGGEIDLEGGEEAEKKRLAEFEQWLLTEGD